MTEINKKIIEIDLTLRCTLHCHNCDRMAPKSLDIPFEALEKFVAEGRTWEKIQLMGGEAILYPKINEVFKLLEFYRGKSNTTFLTNGFNVNLNDVPSWIKIINTHKVSNNQLFKSFNVASIDVGIISGFEKGCDIPSKCGMGLSVDGLYYPCGAGATVSREFNLKIGKQTIDSVTEEDFKKICPYCGHFKYGTVLGEKKDLVRKPTFSHSWNNKKYNTSNKKIRVGFTIILNGLHHLKHNDYVEQISKMFDYFVFVEGVAGNNDSTACTSYPVLDKYHKDFHSIDGTFEFLDKFCKTHPNVFFANNIYSYKGPWRSKDEMCRIATRILKNNIKNISNTFLWEIDADEQWTSDKLDMAEKELVLSGADCGKFFCDYFVGEDLVAVGHWGEGLGCEYVRLWKWKGQEFESHEPPVLKGGNGMEIFLEPRFTHYAYYYEKDVEFKQSFYRNHDNILENWKKLKALQEFPQPLTKFFGETSWGFTPTKIYKINTVPTFDVTKVIHQTWKTKHIPYDVFPITWINTWHQHYSLWKYNLWTDEENFEFIKKNYPDFLKVYESFDLDIKRADIVRYFRLHKDGGLYVDLDCISIKSLIPIFERNDLVLAMEPKENWVWNKNKPFFSNALMYSIPGHKFWEVLFEEIDNINFRNKNPVDETGPGLLSRSYEKYVEKYKIPFVLDLDSYLWSNKNDEEDVNKISFLDNRKISHKTYAVHVSTGTWTNNNTDYREIYKTKNSFRKKKDMLDRNLSYVYTYISGHIPTKVQPILEHNRKICDFFGVPFKIYNFVVEPGECACGKSDWLRVDEARKNKRIMYVDWDCKIKDFPDFDPEIPLMGANPREEIDLWAFYNGDKLYVFDQLLKSFDLKKGQFGAYYAPLNNCDFKKKFSTFTESIQHLCFGTGRLIRPIKVN